MLIFAYNRFLISRIFCVLQTVFSLGHSRKYYTQIHSMYWPFPVPLPYLADLYPPFISSIRSQVFCFTGLQQVFIQSDSIISYLSVIHWKCLLLVCHFCVKLFYYYIIQNKTFHFHVVKKICIVLFLIVLITFLGLNGKFKLQQFEEEYEDFKTSIHGE